MRLTSLPYHELVNVGQVALILLGVVTLYLFYFGCTTIFRVWVSLFDRTMFYLHTKFLELYLFVGQT